MALADSFKQLQSVDFNSLDFNNLGSWPMALKAIMMILLVLLILGGGYMLSIKDKRAALDVAAREEVESRVQYEDKATQAANLEAYLKQKEEMKETLGALLRQLPSDTEVPGLVEDITRTAIDSELKIESIELQPEQKTEFYVELPINIVVEGDHHKKGAFVSAIANLPRIVTLHDFKVEPQGAPQRLKMSMRAKTDRYLPEGDA
ncbi:MAG: pilus assembly protein PilP [Gammaproteobacteria bacterium]|nr:pilus assembly protein PilP [Gammaproteobacteria bacterium]